MSQSVRFLFQFSYSLPIVPIKAFDGFDGGSVFVVLYLAQGEKDAVGGTEPHPFSRGKGGVDLLLIDLTAVSAQILKEFGQTNAGQGVKELLGWNQTRQSFVLGHAFQLRDGVGVLNSKSTCLPTLQRCHDATATKGVADIGAERADIRAGGALYQKLIVTRILRRLANKPMDRDGTGLSLYRHALSRKIAQLPSVYL